MSVVLVHSEYKAKNTPRNSTQEQCGRTCSIYWGRGALFKLFEVSRVYSGEHTSLSLAGASVLGMPRSREEDAPGHDILRGEDV